jgi:hypothetical protein
MEPHWVALAKEFRDADENLVENVNGSIDSLLTFVRSSPLCARCECSPKTVRRLVFFLLSRALLPLRHFHYSSRRGHQRH